jgi:hypothetical protein
MLYYRANGKKEIKNVPLPHNSAIPVTPKPAAASGATAA